MLVIAAHGCVDGDGDDSDERAVLEDAAEGEDPADPPSDTDDVDDLAELDEVAIEEAEDLDPGSPELAAKPTYRNPVAAGCADPGVIQIAGPSFFSTCTGARFPRKRSADLVHWTSDGHIFTAKTNPRWGTGSWWAPEIHRVGSGYVAYFTAESRSRKRKCIGAARASSPEGPFHDLGHPLVCDKTFSLIDPNVFTDRDGKHYLYYKIDGNAQHPPVKTIIYGHQLAADGVGFVGGRRKLLWNTVAWEGLVTEAPFVIRRGSYYYMFYSGATYCNATYGVGIARAKSPLGPFRKRSAPMLKSNAAWSGPGHNSIVRSGGRMWIVYAAWRGDHRCSDDGSRVQLIDPVSWKGGWPSVRKGTPSVGVHTAPAL